MTTTATIAASSLRQGDWIRFQVKSSRIVLEGFIQEISHDRSKALVGKTPLSSERAWHVLDEIAILRHQPK